jgi:hypothetical protein
VEKKEKNKKKENGNRKKKNTIKRERKKIGKQNKKTNKKEGKRKQYDPSVLGSSLDRNARAGHDKPIPNASVVPCFFFFFI